MFRFQWLTIKLALSCILMGNDLTSWRNPSWQKVQLQKRGQVQDTEKATTLVIGQCLSFKRIMIACTVLVAVSLLVFNMRLRKFGTHIVPVNNGSHGSPSVYANPFNVLHDILQLSGHYGYHIFNSSQQYSDILIKQTGLESILHKVRSAILQDENIGATFLPSDNFFKVSRMVKDLNCEKLFYGDKTEIDKAKFLMEKEHATREEINAEEYIEKTKNCSSFITSRGYILSPLTKVEESFPLAFSILMYKNVWQFERLLRVVYRPQNIYCLHVDNKSNPIIFNAVLRISQCFDNVFISSTRFDVRWGEMTVLEPDLTCMQDLWNNSKTWKYFINLTGQEFPLQTNYQLVNILKAFNGANDVESTMKREFKYRWKNAGPIPHELNPVKGNVHVTVTRGYVDFLLHDQRAQDLLDWVRKTHIPDETFFATLNHNPSLNVPGSYRGLPENDPIVKPYLSRFVNWAFSGRPCAGKHVRYVCIFGVGDLPLLVERKELFANKFYYNFEHFALDCMEELLFNRTRDEYFGKRWSDSKWYSQRGFVLNKVDA